MVMGLMKISDWEDLSYFTRNEKWGDPGRMDNGLVFTLDNLRHYVGRPIHVHCGWEWRETGWHPHGVAADIHIENMHIIDQFVAASRFDEFNGIGVYGKDVWANPGLHLDTRPRIHRFDVEARWGCRLLGELGVDAHSKRTYVPLDHAFFEYLLV